MSIVLLLDRLLYNINLGKSVILSCSFHTVGDFFVIVSYGFCVVLMEWFHFGCTMSLFSPELSCTYFVESIVVRF